MSEENALQQQVTEEITGQPPEKKEPVEEHEELTQQEEKETSEQYGKRVQKRINELTKKLRDAERERETDRSVYRQDFERVTQINEELKQAIEAMNKTATVIAEQTKPKLVDVTKEIDAKIKDLKAKKAEAIDGSDFRLASLIDDQIDDLKDQKYTAKLDMELAKEREKAEKERAKDPPKNGDNINPTVEAWAEDTPWFNEDSKEHDPVMHAAAIKIHDMVISDPAWKAKTLRQQLAETRRRTEEKFGYGKKKAPPPDVESVGSFSNAGGDPTKLNDDQKRIAHNFFPDLSPKDAEAKYARGITK